MPVVNIADAVGATFYNGGWVKSVTGLDKSKNNGYSLLGEFVGKGLVNAEPGLYLVNDIGGSRTNQVNNYTLLMLDEEGSVEVLQEVQGTSGYNRRNPDAGKDWAIRLWDSVEKDLARVQSAKLPAPVPTVPDLALLRSLADDLLRMHKDTGTGISLDSWDSGRIFVEHFHGPVEPNGA